MISCKFQSRIVAGTFLLAATSTWLNQLHLLKLFFHFDHWSFLKVISINKNPQFPNAA